MMEKCHWQECRHGSKLEGQVMRTTSSRSSKASSPCYLETLGNFL